MHFLTEINHFYYQMSLQELRLMNSDDYFHGLSYNSLLYLDVISQTPQCTVSKLSALLHITKPAVTLKVNELVRQGFLKKTQSDDDKRVYYLTVGVHINNVYEYYDNIFSGIGAVLEEQYSPEQIALFCGMLRTVSDTDWENLHTKL